MRNLYERLSFAALVRHGSLWNFLYRLTLRLGGPLAILFVNANPLSLREITPYMSTEKKPSKADYKKNPQSFDHQIHQKLATDVIGVSFDAQ